MKIPYKFKKVFPNVLTGFRLGIAPIIIILGLMGKVNIVLLLTILSCLTDLFDGYFARKWDVSSLWILITLEVSIALINLYFYSKTHKSETLLIGKMKTTSLFICIVISFFYLFFHKLHFLLNGFIYMTLNLQILAGSSYIIHFPKPQRKNVDERKRGKYFRKCKSS